MWLETCLRVRTAPVNVNSSSAMSSFLPINFPLPGGVNFRRPMGGHVTSAKVVHQLEPFRLLLDQRTFEESKFQIIWPFLVRSCFLPPWLAFTVLLITLSGKEELVKLLCLSIVVVCRAFGPPPGSIPSVGYLVSVYICSVTGELVIPQMMVVLAVVRTMVGLQVAILRSILDLAIARVFLEYSQTGRLVVKPIP